MSIDSERNLVPSERSAGHRLIPRLGILSLAVAVVFVGVEIIAVIVGSTGHWLIATVLAWAVIVVLPVTLVCGVVAAVRGLGRRFGLAAAVLSLVAHPLLSVWLFGAISGRP